MQALEYVRKQLGFPHSATLACGDSGNDIDMLGGQSLAVVVGNAQVPNLRVRPWQQSVMPPSAMLCATITRTCVIHGVQDQNTF